LGRRPVVTIIPLVSQAQPGYVASLVALYEKEGKQDACLRVLNRALAAIQSGTTYHLTVGYDFGVH
jgi:hypothetical protein